MNGPQIIRSPAGEEMVVLPKAEYDSLMQQLEEAEEDANDRAVYDLRKAELGTVQPLPAAVSSAMLQGETLLRALREWRRMTQSDLARKTGISQGHLSDIENGKRTPAKTALERIARILQLPDGWLV